MREATIHFCLFDESPFDVTMDVNNLIDCVNIWKSSEAAKLPFQWILVLNWVRHTFFLCVALKSITNKLQKSGTWKIQLTIEINFILFKDNKEEQVLYSKRDNIEVMPYDDANEVIKEIFDSLLSRYQIRLEISMRGSNFIFHGVSLLYYKCHKINFKCGGSYVGSPDWIKKKKTTMNSKNKDDKCLQYAATFALNYGEVKWNPGRVSNIKPFINQYNWGEIKYPW